MGAKDAADRERVAGVRVGQQRPALRDRQAQGQLELGHGAGLDVGHAHVGAVADRPEDPGRGGLVAQTEQGGRRAKLGADRRENGLLCLPGLLERGGALGDRSEALVALPGGDQLVRFHGEASGEC